MRHATIFAVHVLRCRRISLHPCWTKLHWLHTQITKQTKVSQRIISETTGQLEKLESLCTQLKHVLATTFPSIIRPNSQYFANIPRPCVHVPSRYWRAVVCSAEWDLAPADPDSTNESLAVSCASSLVSTIASLTDKTIHVGAPPTSCSYKGQQTFPPPCYCQCHTTTSRIFRVSAQPKISNNVPSGSMTIKNSTNMLVS